MACTLKDDMRKKCISARNNVNFDDLLANSKSITKKLDELEYVRQAKTLMCYVSFGSEVYTHDVINKWLLNGKQVCVPHVVKNIDKRSMEAVSISSFKELKPGTFGVLEPPLVESNIVLPDSIDIVIVPGCAFDLNKNRMGYGAGYYDRFLKHTSGKCLKIGIAFDFQVMEEIPCDEYDVPLDILITEKRII